MNDLSEEYLSFFDRFASDADRSLELGCGYGRILLELAQRGHRVDGIERDGSMVAAARMELDRRGISGCRIIHGDFRQTLSAEYDLVYFSNDTLAMLESSEDRADVFARIANMTAPGGRLVLPLAHPRTYLFDPTTQISRTGRLSGGGEFETDEVRFNDLTLGQRIGFRLEAASRNGWREVRSDIRPLAMVMPAEIEILSEAFGFETETHYGDFDLSLLGPESRRFIWVGRRK
ncbi:MAG: class I SAM-dependent methyltransferase [Erythrobacter sp.]|nr:class I SAM-dependent methyltransferase [Erythrobacter sp.]